jgi:large subunit ribosomal protein L4
MSALAKTKAELASVTVERRNDRGEVISSVQLDPAVFGRQVNVPLMHQVVTAQQAARRSGTHSTKTRAEVAGGGAKPYRQKGTGRARQGSIRSPHYAGGGVALGPKPRSYAQRTPQKMTRLALFSALSDRAAEGRLCLVDRWSFEVPRTKEALSTLERLGVEGSVLVVLAPGEEAAARSFANLPQVDLVEAGQLTAYDVLANDWVIFSDATLPGSVSPAEQGEKTARRGARRSEESTAPAAEAEETDGSEASAQAESTEPDEAAGGDEEEQQ